MTYRFLDKLVGALGVFLCLALIVFSVPLASAQQDPPRIDYQTQLEIDDIKERVRTLLAQGQYEQALQELERLEQINPAEPAIEFYRQLAERRMLEGPREGIPAPTPAAGLPPTGDTAPLPPPPPPSGDSLSPVTPEAPRSPGDSADSPGMVPPASQRSSGSPSIFLIVMGLIGLALLAGIFFIIVFLVKRGKKSHVPPVGAMEPAPVATPVSSLPPAPRAPPVAPPGNPYEASPGDSFFRGDAFSSQLGGSPSPTPAPSSSPLPPVVLSKGDFKEIPPVSAPPPPLPAGGSDQKQEAPREDIKTSVPRLDIPSSARDAKAEPGGIGRSPAPLPPPSPVSSQQTPSIGMSPLEFPFEDSAGAAPSFDAEPSAQAKPGRAASGQHPHMPSSHDLSSASFDLGVSFEDEPAPSSSPSPSPDSPEQPSTPSLGNLDDLGFGALGIDLNEPDPFEPPKAEARSSPPPEPSKPAPPNAASSEGISLDDFIFSGDMQTHVPGVSAPQSPPPMSGESQFAKPGDGEPKSAAEDLMFSGIDQTAFPSGPEATAASAPASGKTPPARDDKKPNIPPLVTNIAEDQTIGGLDDAAVERKEQADDSSKLTSGANYITDGDAKTMVTEQTRILSPRDFGVSRMKGDDSEGDSQRATPAASFDQARHGDTPRQAGPMDQTTFLGNIADKKPASSGDGEETKPKTSDTLFDKHFAQGVEAFEDGHWKDAIYHLNVAYTLKPNSQEVRDKLREARRRRKEARNNS